MRECPRCQITFYLDDRIHCLYCDTRLITTEDDRTNLKDPVDAGMMGIAVEPIFQKIVRQNGIAEHSRLQFIVASYFRTRTFYFMYLFSRNDFKTGPVFDRPLIQPLALTSLLLLPWLVVNLFDSFLCRFVYTKYCAKCGWKFYKKDSKGEHLHSECEYNREYKEVVQAILDGTIIQKEKDFKRLGLMKKSAGRHSAYWDMCSRRKRFSAFLDVMCIWFSICLWLLLVIALVFPSVIAGVYMLEV